MFSGEILLIWVYIYVTSLLLLLFFDRKFNDELAVFNLFINLYN